MVKPWGARFFQVIMFGKFAGPAMDGDFVTTQDPKQLAKRKTTLGPNQNKTGLCCLIAVCPVMWR